MLRISNLVRAILPLAAIATAISCSSVTKADTLNGSGSTFIVPIMSLWAAGYQAETGTMINYSGVGSGAGIAALISQTSDFAGSDVPMNSDEKSQAKGGVIHIPDILGSVAVCYNIPGIGPGIHLSGPVLADIFQGKIQYWDDPKIAALSPGTKFPHDSILVIHRSDGSGTTAIFTDYLCKVSASWRNDIKSGKTVNWPVGLGGRGNPGVAGYVKTHPDTIGYVELAYAIKNTIFYAAIENRTGAFIYPYDISSATAAALGEPIPDNLEMSITNTANPAGYPISGYSYLIVPAHSPKAAELRKFISWVITKGQTPDFTDKGHYAPIPAAVSSRAEQLLSKL